MDTKLQYATVPTLIFATLLALPVAVQAQSCENNTSVSTQTGLNAAIECFNAGTPAGNHVISVAEAFTVDGGSTTITRSGSSDELTIQRTGETASLSGVTADNPANDRALFTVNGTNPVRLSALRLFSPGKAGLEIVSGDANVDVDTMLIIGATIAGIIVNDSNANVLLENSRIASSNIGMQVLGNSGGFDVDASVVMNRSTVADSAGHGIEIQNGGHLQISAGSEISGNGQSVAGSAGINVVSGFLTVIDSTISNNVVRGIRATSSLIAIRRSTIQENEANGEGVGIELLGGGDTEIARSSISGHPSFGVAVNGGTMLMSNSTVSSNFDGVFVASNTNVSIGNSTIAFNENDGIGVADEFTRPTVFSSIVAGNGQNCANGAEVNNAGFNFSEPSLPNGVESPDGDSCGFQENDFIATSLDPALTNQGCDTGTGIECLGHRVITGSPAVNRGSCTGEMVFPEIPAVTVDQAGQPRAATCTAGALELLRLSKTLERDRWYQISLPADPGSANTVADVFGDVLPAADLFNVNGGTPWGLYEYAIDTSPAASDDNVPLSGSSVLQQGKGYWIKHLSANPVTVSMPVTANAGEPDPACNGHTCFELSIASFQGPFGRVQMAGYPFEYISDGETLGESVIVGGLCSSPSCTMSEADQRDVFFNLGFQWDGAVLDYREVRAGVGVLNPWDALWVSSSREAFGFPIRWLLPRQLELDTLP